MGSLSQKWEKSSNQVRGVYMTSLQRTKTRYASMWELANAKQRAANLPQGLQQETVMLFSWQAGPSECPLSPSQAACSTRCIPLHLLPNWHHSAQMCSRISLSQESPSAGFDNWKILRTEVFFVLGHKKYMSFCNLQTAQNISVWTTNNTFHPWVLHDLSGGKGITLSRNL